MMDVFDLPELWCDDKRWTGHSCSDFELDPLLVDEAREIELGVPASVGKIVEDPSELSPGDTVISMTFRPVKHYNGHGELHITNESRAILADVIVNSGKPSPKEPRKPISTRRL